ncbi:MAG: hypothetical protein HZC41_02405 [Chloroflexi bacterium]|nr:hypothetical protein [Chloroflexota bacterium]
MTDNNLDRRVQANVPVELKERVRDLVEHQLFESEAEVVRAALWQFFDGENSFALPQQPAAGGEASLELHRDLKERLDLLAWLHTVTLLLLAAIASRLLEAMTHQKVEPNQLIEQALRSSADERDSTRRQLAAGWRAFRDVKAHNSKTQA